MHPDESKPDHGHHVHPSAGGYRRGCVQKKLFVIEDDVYGRLIEDAPPPLASLLPDRTFLVSSLSKTMSVGLRLAYVRVPESHRETMIGNLRASSFFPPPLFLLAGTSRLSQEAFKHVSVPDQRPTFLLVAFAVASAPSICVLAFRRRPVSPGEFAFGFVMGATNFLQTHFILKALQHFAGFVVFPIASAGGLILTTLVATWLLSERINRRTIAGIALASVALVLLHWLPGN